MSNFFRNRLSMGSVQNASSAGNGILGGGFKGTLVGSVITQGWRGINSGYTITPGVFFFQNNWWFISSYYFASEGSIYGYNVITYLNIITNQFSTSPINTFGGTSNTQILSHYLDNGILYTNLQITNVNYYRTFNLSTLTWSANNAGSYTTGTPVPSSAVISGRAFTPSTLRNATSGASVIYDAWPTVVIT